MSKEIRIMSYSNVSYMMGGIRKKASKNQLNLSDPEVKVTYLFDKSVGEDYLIINSSYEVNIIRISEHEEKVYHNYELDEQAINDLMDMYCTNEEEED